MSFFMTGDEMYPFIHIELTKKRMRVHNRGQRQPVARMQLIELHTASLE